MADSQVLKRLDFPAYCIKILDNGLVAIAGGGGTSKTGVGNLIEIGLVDYECPSNKSEFDGIAQFKSIHTFEPEDAIMKFTSFTFERQHNFRTNNGKPIVSEKLNDSEYDLNIFDIYLAAAVNNDIEIFKLAPKLESVHKETNGSINQNSNNDVQLKNRKGRKSSSTNNNPNSNLKASVELKLVSKVNLKSIESNNQLDDPFDDQFESNTNTTATRNRKRTASIRSDEETITSLATCKINNSVSKCKNVYLCAGTSKGSIIIWSILVDNNNNTSDKIKFEKLHEFKEAHGNHEVDDLQTKTFQQNSPVSSGELKKLPHNTTNGLKMNKKNENEESNILLSIGRDNKCIIWSLKNFEKLAQINYTTTLNNDTNLRMKHARFSTYSNVFYATFIPRIRGGNRDMSSYIQRWSFNVSKKSNSNENDLAFNYKFESKCRMKNTILTTIQCSKDGNYVCVGDYEGRIDLFDFNFNRIINFKKQHSSVITDLIFYHDFTNCKKNNNDIKYDDKNKLILTISIDRTLQCYKYINTRNSNEKNDLSIINTFDLCSMNTFKIIIFFILFILIFCYFFTFVE